MIYFNINQTDEAIFTVNMMKETIAEQQGDREWAIAQLGLFKGRFDGVLNRFLQDKVEEAGKIRPELARMLEVCTEFVMAGGKRLRPAFVYYGWKAVNGVGDEDVILKAAVPLELVHAGALVHDDVMDNSDLRRGRPTVHKVFEKEMGNAEVGRSLAIVAGDMVLALADEAFSAYPDFGGNFKNARMCFDEMCKEINYGQHLDVVANLLPSIGEDWIMKVMRYKTAGYTVEKPLLIGAILGGSSPGLLSRISEFGVNLGVAFQIKDDLLGMFGNQEKVGKPVDSDLKEGKKTLLTAKTLERLWNEGRQTETTKFQAILGNPNLTPDEYHWCQELMRETGAVDYCQDRVEELTEAAVKSLSQADINDEAKRYLVGISTFLVAREY